MERTKAQLKEVIRVGKVPVLPTTVVVVRVEPINPRIQDLINHRRLVAVKSGKSLADLQKMADLLYDFLTPWHTLL